jgi:DNA-binding response OmpR family regulator
MNILVVEDERLMADLIRSIVFTIPLIENVDIAHNYRDALRRLSAHRYAMVLVDLYLNNEPHGGLDLCKKIREGDPFIPLIVITSDTSFESQKKAFGFTVNDYIKKPFYPQELLIRVQRWLPTHKRDSPQKLLRYHQLAYSCPNNEFLFNDQKINLTKKKKALLLLLLQKKEKLITTEILQEKLWGDFDPLESNRNIRSSIQLLRKALKRFSCDHWIITVRGEGYMLKKNDSSKYGK